MCRPVGVLVLDADLVSEGVGVDPTDLSEGRGTVLDSWSSAQLMRPGIRFERSLTAADGDELLQVFSEEGGDVARRLVLRNVAQLVPQEAQVVVTTTLDEHRVVKCQARVVGPSSPVCMTSYFRTRSSGTGVRTAVAAQVGRLAATKEETRRESMLSPRAGEPTAGRTSGAAPTISR